MLFPMAGKDLGEAFVDDFFAYFQFVLQGYSQWHARIERRPPADTFSSFSAYFLMLSPLAGKDLGEVFVDDFFVYFQVA